MNTDSASKKVSHKFSEDKTSPVYIAGHRGMVGSALVHNLQALGFSNLVLRDHKDLDLTNQTAVHEFFREARPKYVFLVAAKAGGILANSEQKTEFLYENMLIEFHTMHAAAEVGVEKLLFLGSSCIYPKLAAQPISEDALLTGPLEPTNEGYALAKIAGLKLCEYYNRYKQKRFISGMPCNLYGEGDRFDARGSHVIPALLMKMHEAKNKGASHVEIWGTGKPLREFLHVYDCAKACIKLMDAYEEATTINIGSGMEISIHDLAQLIKDVVGFKGELQFSAKYPDGTPRKVVDVTRIHHLGWHHEVELSNGLKRAYNWAVSMGKLG